LNREQRAELVKDFAAEMARKGMVVDVAIHAPDARNDERNFHVHMLLTMREITPEGFGNKVREWNRDTELEQWKERWSELGASHLERAGFYQEAERFRVGHLTLEKQREAAHQRGDYEWAKELDREPTKHMGPQATAMEEQGIRTRKGDQNREIEQRNHLRARAKELSRTEGEIRLAYQLTDSAQAFADAQEDRGLILARVSPQDLPKLAQLEKRHFAEKEAEHQRKLRYIDKRISEEMHLGNRDKAAELLRNHREKWVKEFEANRPWMVRQGGIERLTSEQRERARASYDSWQHKDRYSFENYVSYVQKTWQERPAESSRYKLMDLVVVNQRGEVYGISERNTGDTPKLLRHYLKDIDKAPLFSVIGAWQVLKEFHHHRREEALWPERERVWPINPPQPQQVDRSSIPSALAAPQRMIDFAKYQVMHDKRPLNAPDDLNKERSLRFPEQPNAVRIYEAFNRNRNDPKAFAAALDEHGILLACVTKMEADRSYRSAAFAKELNRFSPSYKDGEIVAIAPDARVYKLDDRTTDADPRDLEKFFKKLDKTQLPSIHSVTKTMRERAEAREAAVQLTRLIYPVKRPEFERSLAIELRHITRDVRYAASTGIYRAWQAGSVVGKVLEFGADIFESFFAPTLTPEQRYQGEMAARARQIAEEQAARQRSYNRDR
jgi:hypothetical protein